MKTVWANGYKPPQYFEFTTRGYDTYAKARKTFEHKKYRQEQAYDLFKHYPALTAAQVASLLGIENSAACHLLNKMGELKWTMEKLPTSTAPMRVYRSRG